MHVCEHFHAMQAILAGFWMTYCDFGQQIMANLAVSPGSYGNFGYRTGHMTTLPQILSPRERIKLQDSDCEARSGKYRISARRAGAARRYAVISLTAARQSGPVRPVRV